MLDGRARPPFFVAGILAFFRRQRQAFCSFAAIQAMQLLLPLLALPWLARILGPDSFGLLMYFCLIPPLVALFMDWGLTVGGSRDASALRGNRISLSRLLGAVLSARLILFIICLGLCAALYPFLPYVAFCPLAYMAAVLAGVARGSSPAWFFQGAGFGMPVMAAFDVGASCATLLLVFTFIHSPADWQLYLFFLVSTRAAAYGCLTAWLCCKFQPQLDFGSGYRLIRRTAPLFVSAFALMLCYNGSQLILGCYLSTGSMGIIAAVTKMLRAFASLINPFSQTLFPEICILRQKSPAHTRKLLRWSLLLSFLAASLGAALVWLAAPVLIAIALGAKYRIAGETLRIAICAAPLLICNNILANQILVPFGQERRQAVMLGLCAAASAPIAAFLGCCWGITGGAILPVCLELLILTGFMLLIHQFCPQALFGKRITEKESGALRK